MEELLRAALAAQHDLGKTLSRLTKQHADILEAVQPRDGDRAADLVERHIRSFYRATQRDA